MKDLLPHITAQLNDVLGSLPYFMPEIYLTVLFIVVLLTDLLFGKNSAKLCRIVASVGMLLVIFKVLQQVAITGADAVPIFSNMLILHRTAIAFKFIIDVLAFILLLYFAWTENCRNIKKVYRTCTAS
jgi:NADH-quinone oxidoreductase subunit N